VPRSGIVGGVFFAFSTFVMKALAELPAAHGIAAMQRINVVVLGPLFLGVFVGTAVLAGICVLAGFFPWGEPKSFLLLAAGLLYIVGSFGITVALNVPRNERLARMSAESADAAAYWPRYVREWLFWNHLRSAASVAAAGCAAAALTYMRANVPLQCLDSPPSRLGRADEVARLAHARARCLVCRATPGASWSSRSRRARMPPEASHRRRQPSVPLGSHIRFTDASRP
jgi:uncharacterized membrane protein